MKKLQKAIYATKKYYLKDDKPWAIGFSGGKDSSLVAKIVFSAIKDLPKKQKRPIQILYCDTGVEIPTLKSYITCTLHKIETEWKSYGIDTISSAIKPKLDNLFFVKVIGRGYPPPTNKFRWCTDKIRIEPIQSAIRNHSANGESIVVLGTRYNESEERSKVLDRYSTSEPFVFTQSGYPDTKIFCPIIELNTDEVWEALLTLEGMTSINMETLSNVYREISGECPIVRMPNSNPCSKGRFGCWTCTVVRKDKASLNLIKNGHISLIPLLDFRSWLLKIRDDLDYRCSIRRNGVKGLGPFRLSARKIILRKLLRAQKESGHKIIEDNEIRRIKELWKIDKKTETYKED